MYLGGFLQVKTKTFQKTVKISSTTMRDLPPKELFFKNIFFKQIDSNQRQNACFDETFIFSQLKSCRLSWPR